MSGPNRIVTGSAMIVFGLTLSSIPFIVGEKGLFSLYSLSVPALILGFFVLFNKKEDEIEERKDLVKKKGGNKK